MTDPGNILISAVNHDDLGPVVILSGLAEAMSCSPQQARDIAAELIQKSRQVDRMIAETNGHERSVPVGISQAEAQRQMLAAQIEDLRHQQGVQIDGLETWVRYEHTKHRMRCIALLEHKGEAPSDDLMIDINDVALGPRIMPNSPDEAVRIPPRVAESKAFVAATEAIMEGFKARGVALCEELFGPAEKPPSPPREIPADLMDGFTMAGRVPIGQNYLDATYPANWPLIYTDYEIDFYLDCIKRKQWYIYGQTDFWVWDAIGMFPIKGMRALNMGSLTPWYEATCLHYGAQPTTIDYNKIISKSARVTTMTVGEAEGVEPFDVAFSISSFEHDGLGMYGDPLDPDGDLKAMRKMKERIKPGGLMFFAVPIGKDKILFNNARIYGRLRLPLMLEGWTTVRTLGMLTEHYDGPGHVQPVFVLRND